MGSHLLHPCGSEQLPSVAQADAQRPLSGPAAMEIAAAAEENSVPRGSGPDHKEEDMDTELSNLRFGAPICTLLDSSLQFIQIAARSSSGP